MTYDDMIRAGRDSGYAEALGLAITDLLEEPPMFRVPALAAALDRWPRVVVEPLPRSVPMVGGKTTAGVAEVIGWWSRHEASRRPVLHSVALALLGAE